MAKPRVNPVAQPQRRIALSQSVVNPQGNDGSVNGNNPAKLRVPSAKGSKIFQSVGNPVGKRKHNMTGDSGNH